MKKKILGILGSVLLLSAMVTPTVSAVTDCGTRPYVEFYKDINYGNFMGRFCYAYNMSNLNIWPGWNDAISSYKVRNFSGRDVTLYIDINYQGITVGTHSCCDVPNLGVYWKSRFGDGFNDKASSFRVW